MLVGPIMKGLAQLCYLGSLLSLASPSEDSELPTMVNGEPELPTIAHRDPELPTMVHLPASASDISCNSAEKRRWEGWKVGPDRYYRSFGGQATQLWSEADRHGVSEHNLTRHPFSKA